MGFNDFFFNLPGKPRIATVGTAVAGALARFVDRAGKIAASLVTVDDSGNVTTPGTVTAGDSNAKARMGESDTGFVQFSNTYAEGLAPSAQTGFRQYADGSCTVRALGTPGVATTADLEVAGASVRATDTGCQAVVVANSAAGETAPRKGAILDVQHVEDETPGGVAFPSMTTAVRDDISETAPPGVMIYNETLQRFDTWDGLEWWSLPRVNSAGDLEVAGNVTGAEIHAAVFTGGEAQTFVDTEAALELTGKKTQTGETTVIIDTGVTINRGGATGQEASAVLTLNGLGGFMLPRLSVAQRDAIVDPADGLLILNADTGLVNIKLATGWATLALVP